MRNRKILYVALFILVIAALFPTAMAYMFKQTETVKNELIPAEVSCEVEEKFEEIEVNNTVEVNKNRKVSVQVKNTSNIEAYIRVRVVSYWQDSKGNIVARPSVMPTFTVSKDWIKAGGYDTYYYKYPVKAGEYTAEFLGENSVITLMQQTETDGIGVTYTYNQVVEIFAEAIQSLPEEAVEKSWNDVEVSDDRSLKLKTTQNNN